MSNRDSKETAVLKAGYGFDVGANFARARSDTPIEIARSEYAKPGHVIGYIAADANSPLGFLKYGNREGKIRIHCVVTALVS